MTRFVLVPGAGGVAWYWSRVAARLAHAGHEPVPVDLPGDDEDAGLATYAELASAAVGDDPGAVLVAQSLGGFTAPLVAELVTLRAIVFVNAMIPVAGERAGEWWDATGANTARIDAARRHGYPVELDPQVYFLHDVPPEIAAEGEAHHRNETAAAFDSPCAFSTWPAIPIRVVAGADDRFFPVELQRRVARDRLGVEADVLPGGHLLVLSQPRALADYLEGV